MILVQSGRNDAGGDPTGAARVAPLQRPGRALLGKVIETARPVLLFTSRHL
jgi:hypothetical protein